MADNRITIEISGLEERQIAEALTADFPSLTLEGSTWTGWLADHRETLAVLEKHAPAAFRRAASRIQEKIAEARRLALAEQIAEAR